MPDVRRQVGDREEGSDEDEHHNGGPLLLVKVPLASLVAAGRAHLLAPPHLQDDQRVEDGGEGKRQDVLGDGEREGANAAKEDRHTVVDPDDAAGD